MYVVTSFAQEPPRLPTIASLLEIRLPFAPLYPRGHSLRFSTSTAFIAFVFCTFALVCSTDKC